MAKKYELVLILDPQVGDTQLESVVDNYKTRLESAGAEVVHVDKWGLRKLAYTSMALRQRQQAFYVLFQFQGDNELFGALEPELKLDESVLRHLFVAVQGEFLRVPQLAPENVYIYHPPDRTRDRRGPRRDRRDDGPPRPDREEAEGGGGGGGGEAPAPASEESVAVATESDAGNGEES